MKGYGLCLKYSLLLLNTKQLLYRADMRFDGEMQTAELLALYLALANKFESMAWNKFGI